MCVWVNFVTFDSVPFQCRRGYLSMARVFFNLIRYWIIWGHKPRSFFQWCVAPEVRKELANKYNFYTMREPDLMPDTTCHCNLKAHRARILERVQERKYFLERYSWFDYLVCMAYVPGFLFFQSQMQTSTMRSLQDF